MGDEADYLSSLDNYYADKHCEEREMARKKPINKSTPIPTGTYGIKLSEVYKSGYGVVGLFTITEGQFKGTTVRMKLPQYIDNKIEGEMDMKSTGIVRRVDDLGRVVIPKEIRRTLRIREGDPLEIYTDGKSVVFEKYSCLAAFDDAAKQFADSLHQVTGHRVIITDVTSVIAESPKPLRGSCTSQFPHEILCTIQNKKQLILHETTATIPMIGDCTRPEAQIIEPIVVDGIPVGSIILMAYNGDIGLTELTAVKVALNLLSSQLEI